MSEKKKNPQIKRPAKKPAGKAVKQSAPKKTIFKSTVKSNTKTRSAKAPAKKKAKQKPSIRIAFLGGLNEIGKNMTVFECEGDMLILDCGMAFPDGDMLGVDMVIPDYTYIEQNRDKIRGVVITHGHEDHIGGIPYLLSKVNVPIYGTPLTIGLIENKLREHSLSAPAELIKKNAGDHIKLGCFDVELIHVNHSIPDAVAVATPVLSDSTVTAP